MLNNISADLAQALNYILTILMHLPRTSDCFGLPELDLALIVHLNQQPLANPKDS